MVAKTVLVYHHDDETRRWIADTVHSGHGKFKVVADSKTMSEALVLARFHQPQIIVVGFRADSETQDLAYSLRGASPKSVIVGYLEQDEDDHVGVPGYDAFIAHKRKPQKLLEALERASGSD